MWIICQCIVNIYIYIYMYKMCDPVILGGGLRKGVPKFRPCSGQLGQLALI